MGDQTQAYDIFQTPLSYGYPLPLMQFMYLYVTYMVWLSMYCSMCYRGCFLHADCSSLDRVSKLLIVIIRMEEV